ncbi:hypothetical protein NFI96_001954 [Prochilodus magdalenae]|nr:hypothetical protein NFI96_001954 [Prochilodus magdalenae]
MSYRLRLSIYKVDQQGREWTVSLSEDKPMWTQCLNPPAALLCLNPRTPAFPHTQQHTTTHKPTPLPPCHCSAEYDPPPTPYLLCGGPVGVLTIEEQGNNVCRETDGVQSVSVELQSAPMWSVKLRKWTMEVSESLLEVKMGRGHHSEKDGAVGADPKQIQSRSRADLGQIQSRSRADPEQIKSRSRADPEQIQSRSRADLEQIQSRSRADSEQIKSGSRADPEQIQSRSRIDPEQIQSRSRADLEQI